MQQNTCAPAGDDWNTSGLGVQTETQAGTYNTNNKDASDPSGWTSGGGTPDKADFQRAYSFARVVNGHYIVYLGWERTATSGTQSYNIELDNTAANVADDGTPQPNRSEGGAVFYIDAQGGGLPTFGSGCTFTSQSSYGSTCTNASAGFAAAFNSASITDPLNGNAGIDSGGFDEVSLDVTALTGITPSCPGASAASVYARSATGTTHKNLKGYLPPFTLRPDSTCVAPHIDTTATPGGDLNPLGAAQHDEVTVGNFQGSVPGVGSVKFFLCKPNEVTAGGCEGSAGTLVSTDTLDANGKASSATLDDSTTPNDNAVGTYCWRAEFTPGANDHNYLARSHTNSDTECFTVVHASPTITTQIAVTGDHAPGLGFTTLGDTATLHGFVGSVADETISFNLYGPFADGVSPTCDAAHVVAAAATTGKLNAGGRATTEPTYQPTAAGTYVWVASYRGDTLNDGVTGRCTDADESATIVGAQLDVSKSANPPGPVTAGTNIGFDLTVTNEGSVPATGVHLTDNLPADADGAAGGDLDWVLDPAFAGCTISGAVGSQLLDCTFNQVDGPGSLPVIHISSPTSPFDCGTVKNKASITTTNGTGKDSDVATVTVLCPHLAIDKTADAPSVSVGSPIGFTITATNDGQGTASGVLVSDPLPTGPGIAWSVDAANTTGPLSCSNTSNTLTCTGSLAAGATETVHITSPTQWTGGTVTPAANSCLGGPNGGGLYVNTAHVSATNVVSSPSDDAQTQVLCPDLAITKSHDAAAVSAGTPIGFTITAANSAAGNGTGVLIDDPLPTGTGVSWSIDAANTSGPLGCSITAGDLKCTGTLAAGATESVHVTSPTQFESCAIYDNTATLSAANDPQTPSAGASTQVLCANVVIEKTADADSVSVGSNVGFAVTLTNSGAGTASGVDLEDPLPAGEGISWQLDSSTGPLTCSVNGTAPNQTLKCTGTLQAAGGRNDAETVHITSSTRRTTDLNSCGVYNNTAAVTWSSGPDQPVSSDQATETVLCPDLMLTKTADAASVDAGDQIGFVVELTNSGPGTASGATINDPLPSGIGVDWSIAAVSGTAVDNCGVTGSAGSQVLGCVLGDLGPDAHVVVHVLSDTTSNSCGPYDNTATVHATNVPGANASASLDVQCAHLTIDKTADAARVNVGSNIGFTVTVTNDGGGTANGVSVTDSLPTGPGVTWTVDRANTSGPLACGISNDALGCTGTIASGAAQVVHITSPTDWTGSGQDEVNSCDNGNDGVYDNTAQVSATNVDDSPQASAQTRVLCPDLSIIKTADAAQVNAGKHIGFMITASNTGLGDATGALVHDALPTGPADSGVSWSIDEDSGPLTCVLGSHMLDCTGTLPSGASQTVHVISHTSFASCATYGNTATLTADHDPQAPSSSASTRVLCADLQVTKTADADSVRVGSGIGFTATIANHGNGTAFDVDGADPLPAGPGILWQVDSSTGPLTCGLHGDAPAQTLSCTGTLQPAGDRSGKDVETAHVVSATVDDGTLNSCGTYDNTASVIWGNGPDGPRTSSASEDVLCPDLTLTKTADAASVSAGDPIGFVVELTNAGPGAATGVRINDPLPRGQDISWTIGSVTGTDHAACLIADNQGAQVLSCDLGDLGPGTAVAVHVVSATTPNSCGSYDNTATLTTTNVPGSDASASASVLCAGLSLTKTADAASVAAGDAIGFTITAHNGGPGTARGVKVDDELPKGSGVSWSVDNVTGAPATDCAVGAGNGGQVLDCTIGDLVPNAEVTVHVVSQTDVTSCARYDNTATLTATNAAQIDATASTRVTTCLGVAPAPNPPPPPPVTQPVAVTGLTLLGPEILGGVLLIGVGGLLMLAATRRRRAREH